MNKLFYIKLRATEMYAKKKINKIDKKLFLYLIVAECKAQYLLYLSRYCVYKVPENNESYYLVIISNNIYI